MVRRCQKSEMEVLHTYTKAQDVVLVKKRDELFLVEGCFPIWNCFSEGKVYHGFQREETTCFLAQGTFWSSM